jgi:hypothetical protein
MDILSGSEEEAFVAACARLHVDESGEALISRLLERGLNWDSIPELAGTHYVATLLYNTLVRLRLDVPKSALERLREINIATASVMMRLQEELAGIARALDREGLHIMLLKGAALQQTVYRDEVFRPMSDIDILVQEDEFPAIGAVFTDLGFSTERPLPELTARELVEYAHYFDQIKFINERRVKIDTHFRLLNMGVPTPGEETVWGRAQEIQLGGAVVSVPSPEDMLLHLCFNANHHYFARMSYFCDIHEVHERYADAFDWDRLVHAAGRRRMSASIYHALLYTRRALGTPIPEAPLAELRPGAVRRKLYEVTWERVLIRKRRAWRLGSLEGPIYSFLEMDGLGVKLKFFFKCAFPPLRWLSCSFSEPRSMLLYVKYIVSLVRRREAVR